MSSSPGQPSGEPSSALLSLDEMLQRLSTPLTAKELWKLSLRIGMSAEQFERLSGANPHRLRRGRGADESVDLAKNAPFTRCAKVFRRVVALCNGDENAARQWLNAEAPVLKNRKPVEVAETAPGAKQVDNLVAQLEKAAGLAGT